MIGDQDRMDILRSPLGRLFLETFADWTIKETSLKMSTHESLTSMVVFQYGNCFLDCRWNEESWSFQTWDRSDPRHAPEPIHGVSVETLQSTLSQYMIEEIHRK